MKKLAKDLKKGEEIEIAEQPYILESLELSDIGKQGKRKCRIVALNSKGEKMILIRPEDYPFEVNQP